MLKMWPNHRRPWSLLATILLLGGCAQVPRAPLVQQPMTARADSVAQGIWPPKGGPAHLTTNMVSTIAMPTAVSPLK